VFRHIRLRVIGFGNRIFGSGAARGFVGELPEDVDFINRVENLGRIFQKVIVCHRDFFMEQCFGVKAVEILVEEVEVLFIFFGNLPAKPFHIGVAGVYDIGFKELVPAVGGRERDFKFRRDFKKRLSLQAEGEELHLSFGIFQHYKKFYFGRQYRRQTKIINVSRFGAINDREGR